MLMRFYNQLIPTFFTVTSLFLSDDTHDILRLDSRSSTMENEESDEINVIESNACVQPVLCENEQTLDDSLFFETRESKESGCLKEEHLDGSIFPENEESNLQNNISEIDVKPTVILTQDSGFHEGLISDMNNDVEMAQTEDGSCTNGVNYEFGGELFISQLDIIEKVCNVVKESYNHTLASNQSQLILFLTIEDTTNYGGIRIN